MFCTRIDLERGIDPKWFLVYTIILSHAAVVINSLETYRSILGAYSSVYNRVVPETVNPILHIILSHYGII